MASTPIRDIMKEQFLTWLNAGTWETLLPDQVTDITEEPMIWVPYINPEINRLYRAEIDFRLFTIRIVTFIQPDVARTATMDSEIRAMQDQLAVIATPVIGSPGVLATQIDFLAPQGWARNWLAKFLAKIFVQPPLDP